MVRMLQRGEGEGTGALNITMAMGGLSAAPHLGATLRITASFWWFPPALCPAQSNGYPCSHF